MAQTISTGIYIPFQMITRQQAAELLGVSPYTVDKYTKIGYRAGSEILYLKKQSNGQFKTSDFQDFFNKKNLYRYALGK